MDFGSFNPGHPQIPAAAEKGRNNARTDIIEHFGGDPLAWQARPMKVGEKEVVMLWRTRIAMTPLEEVRLLVRRWIFLLPDGLFPITDWVLLYHRCENGQQRRCGPWITLDEGIGIPSPSSFNGGS